MERAADRTALPEDVDRAEVDGLVLDLVLEASGLGGHQTKGTSR